MKRILAFTCFLCLSPLRGQMPMQMPMEGMPAHTKPAHPNALKPQPATVKHSGQQSTKPPQPVVPFGQLADGDTSLQPRPAAATPTPIALPATLQEQEHPERRTGSEDASMPDLLADAKVRAPEPLQFFTERAAKSNPTLRQAEAQVRRLHAEAKQAGLWQNPEIGYEADHVRGGSYAGGEQGGYVQQTIPLAGQRSSARDAITARAIAAETVLAAQRRRVESAVAQAFYAALAVQREIELRGQMAALASDAVIASHQLANIGQADAPDVLGSEVEREQAKLELASAQRAYRKAWAALAAISGDAALPIAPLAGDLTAVPVLGPAAESDAAEGSLMVKAAQQQAAAGEAAIRSARKQAGPQLVLKGGLQQDNEPLEPSRRVGVVGIAQAGLTLPLWNRNQGAVEAARAQQAGAQAEVARTQLSLHMQAEQQMQDYSNAMNQARIYHDELLPRAQRTVELYQQKYAAMAAAYPQTVAAQKTLLQLQVEYTRALGAAWQSAVLLQHGLLEDGLAAPELIEANVGTQAGN
ncbi:TolC family protein [Terriglobus sp.]|uniref:TolC family protein n=1 Tax=Terriglobus sp. TaxID=1889013 RepID=UPI003B0046AE